MLKTLASVLIVLKLPLIFLAVHLPIPLHDFTM